MFKPASLLTALVAMALAWFPSAAWAQNATSTAVAAPGQSSSPWPQLQFLLGTWEARTGDAGTAGAKVIGVYSFAPELNGHILARYSGDSSCKAPTSFDCEHSDLLYLYPEGTAIKAIYFDNEGHTIHYDVTTPSASSAVFLSDATTPGPQFRLVYERKEAILSGKFQMRMPGQADFKSYLEWSGSKK